MSSFPMDTIPQPSEQDEHPLLRPDTQLESSESDLDQGVSSTLDDASSSKIKRLSPHVAVLVIPLCFLVLGACIARINGEPKSSTGSAIMQAAKLAATLWPIAFAAVVGPMVKTIALYTAERGTNLGTLEVLSASQTLVSTLRGCFSIRIFSLWIFVVTTVWALSPAGGQGVLRAVEPRKNRTTSDIRLQSFPINNVSVSGPAFSGTSSSGSTYNGWSAMSGATILSPDVQLIHSNGSSSKFQKAVERAGGKSVAIASTKRDLWNNVRVPFLHLLAGYQGDRPYEWVDVPPNEVPPYESLIGIPMRGIPSRVSGNASIIISSNYQHLTCGPWLNETEWLLNNPFGISFNTITNGTINMSGSAFDTGGYPNTFLDLLNDTHRSTEVATAGWVEPTRKQVLVFGSSTGYPNNITLCEITTSYVDSNVSCTRSSDNGEALCGVNAVRHTSGLPVSGNLTALEQTTVASMLQAIPFVLSSRHTRQPGILDKLLKDPLLTFEETYDTNTWYYEDVPMNFFQARLGMLLNTFIRASYDMPSLVGMKSMTLDNETEWANMTGIWTVFTKDIYDIQTPWFILYLTSTIVLTLCGLVNIVLRTMIRAPDFLGSISALTRDSPFVDAPPGGSTMDGTERARLLKDKWVRIQDVKPDEEVGRIAFSDAKGPGGLRIGRRYE